MRKLLIKGRVTLKIFNSALTVHTGQAATAFQRKKNGHKSDLKNLRKQNKKYWNAIFGLSLPGFFLKT